MEQIIEKNLALMRSNEKLGLVYLSARESVGGNAGCFGNYPCFGANFVFDSHTGEILAFGNYQDLPKSIQRSPNCRDIFRLAIDCGKTWRNRIIDYTPKTGSPEVRKILEATVERYNNKYGFSLEETK